MAGIAALMVVSQLGKATGVKIEGDSFLHELWFAVTHLGEVHGPTLALALVVLSSLLAFNRWAPRWPGPLVVMLAAAAVVKVLDLQADGVAVVGKVPQGLPPIALPQLDDLGLGPSCRRPSAWPSSATATTC